MQRISNRHKFLLIGIIMIGLLILPILLDYTTNFERQTNISGLYANNEKLAQKLTTMTLYEATHTYTGYVTVIIKGTGSFYGDCISISATQITDEDVTINIEKGVVLIPSDSSYQNMIIAQTTQISLTYNGHQITKYVYAFCAQIHNDIPSSSTTFSVSLSSYGSSSNVGKVLIYLESHTSYYDSRSGQCAIWACTDGVSDVTSDYYGDESTRNEANQILSGAGTGLTIPKSGGSSRQVPGFTWLLNIIGLVLGISLVIKKLQKKQNFPTFFN